MMISPILGKNTAQHGHASSDAHSYCITYHAVWGIIQNDDGAPDWLTPLTDFDTVRDLFA